MGVGWLRTDRRIAARRWNDVGVYAPTTRALKNTLINSNSYSQKVKKEGKATLTAFQQKYVLCIGTVRVCTGFFFPS